MDMPNQEVDVVLTTQIFDHIDSEIIGAIKPQQMLKAAMKHHIQDHIVMVLKLSPVFDNLPKLFKHLGCGRAPVKTCHPYTGVHRRKYGTKMHKMEIIIL